MGAGASQSIPPINLFFGKTPLSQRLMAFATEFFTTRLKNFSPKSRVLQFGLMGPFRLRGYFEIFSAPKFHQSGVVFERLCGYFYHSSGFPWSLCQTKQRFNRGFIEVTRPSICGHMRVSTGKHMEKPSKKWSTLTFSGKGSCCQKSNCLCLRTCISPPILKSIHSSHLQLIDLAVVL